MANIVEIILKGRNDTASAIASSVKGLQGLDSAISGISRHLAGIVSVGALTALVKSAVDLGGELSDASKKFGVSAEELSKLQYVAKLSGVEFEELGGSFKFLSKAIAESENPSSAAAIAFKAMGVSLADLRTKSPNEIFMLLADRFSEMKDGANKAALAMEIFGRSGANILPVFEKGAAEIKRLKDEAVATGAALSEEQIAKLDGYGDAIDRMGMRAKTTAGVAFIELIDRIKEIGETAAKYGPAIEGVIYNMGFEQPGPGAMRFKAPPLPTPPAKIEPPNIEALKKGIKDEGKVRDEGQKQLLKQLAERAEVLGKFYGDEGEIASMLADEDIARGERAIALAKDRAAYAEDLAGTMAALSTYDPEMDLAAGMAELGNVAKEVGPVVNRMLSEQYDRAAALSELYATIYRGQDGMIADLANATVDSFHRMTDSIVDFAMTGKANFRDFANSVIADLMRIMVKQSVTQPLYAGIQSGLESIFGGGRAAGGPVVPGMVYSVGERGVELFAPSVPGTIIPNGGGGGNGNVTVNIKNQSGTPVSARASSSFDLQGAVIDIVLDGINRNVGGDGSREKGPRGGPKGNPRPPLRLHHRNHERHRSHE